MGDSVSIAIGFMLGILASGIAALVYEYGTRPLLQVLLDDSPRAQGQKPGQAPHEFYHLKVRNVPPRWPLLGRRPAWACKATIEVFDHNGKRVIPDTIIARWPSQPEPLIPAVNAGQVIAIRPYNLLFITHICMRDKKQAELRGGKINEGK
jgi:hypothetical protein